MESDFEIQEGDDTIAIERCIELARPEIDVASDSGWPPIGSSLKWRSGVVTIPRQSLGL